MALGRVKDRIYIVEDDEQENDATHRIQSNVSRID